ncbi:MAG: hypothetical protein IJU65_06775 [Desulfovibrio sp.]|nr:hypothetical protein [Desulfovibrio sp.]
MLVSLLQKLFPLGCMVLLATSAVCAEPANHAKLMTNSEYKQAFETYSATLQEARTCLDAKDFASVQKTVQAEMDDSVKEDVASGTAEVEAWSTAYSVGRESLNRELKWDWLRRHPEGIQGFYRMQSKAFDGWLTVEKGDKPDLYAVQIYAIQKNAPNNSGELDGFGKLTDHSMNAVDKNDDQNPVSITFKGDTATIAEPKAFKESGALGAGVSFDGDFAREKK